MKNSNNVIDRVLSYQKILKYIEKGLYEKDLKFKEDLIQRYGAVPTIDMVTTSLTNYLKSVNQKRLLNSFISGFEQTNNLNNSEYLQALERILLDVYLTEETIDLLNSQETLTKLHNMIYSGSSTLFCNIFVSKFLTCYDEEGVSKLNTELLNFIQEFAKLNNSELETLMCNCIYNNENLADELLPNTFSLKNISELYDDNEKIFFLNQYMKKEYETIEDDYEEYEDVFYSFKDKNILIKYLSSFNLSLYDWGVLAVTLNLSMDVLFPNLFPYTYLELLVDDEQFFEIASKNIEKFDPNVIIKKFETVSDFEIVRSFLENDKNFEFMKPSLIKKVLQCEEQNENFDYSDESEYLSENPYTNYELDYPHHIEDKLLSDGLIHMHGTFTEDLEEINSYFTENTTYVFEDESTYDYSKEDIIDLVLESYALKGPRR